MPSSPVISFSWRVGAWALAAALCGGCSLLFHADAEQCSTDSDCRARGAALGTICSAGTCVEPTVNDTPDGAGTPDAGAEAGCNSNADCPPSVTIQGQTFPVACDVDLHSCLQLTSPECPYTIGDYSGSVQPPVFLGAWATLPASEPESDPSYLNYAFALNEFSTTTGGVPWGASGRRMPVAIICDDSQNTDNAMAHLVGDVHVSSVIAALPSSTLSQVFTMYAAQSQSDIFVVNPFSWDSNLAALGGTHDLLWSMLGPPGDVAPAYAAFLPLVETYIRNHTPWNLGPTTPMKVATVWANATDLIDLSNGVDPVLQWNVGASGGPSTVADTANYLNVEISQSILNGTSLASIDVTSAVQAILSFEPQVIISFASLEFDTVLQDVEIGWTTSMGAKPFYLIGPYNQGDPELQTLDAQIATLPTRIAGIGVAAAADSTVLDQYNSDFLSFLEGPQMVAPATASQDLGSENYYDAIYFAVYAMVAAAQTTPVPTGSDVAQAMALDLVGAPPDEQLDVGSGDMTAVFSALENDHEIGVVGTLGPPDFDSNGARISQGDVYCLQENGAGAYSFDYDVLRLQDGGASDGGVGLQGPIGPDGSAQGFPCYPGIP